MKKNKPKFGKLTVTFENVNEAQAIAMKKMFEYWEQLGQIGSSRDTTFFAASDADFRPIVNIETNLELPEVAVACVNNDGDFSIDYDSIAWKIYE